LGLLVHCWSRCAAIVTNDAGALRVSARATLEVGPPVVGLCSAKGLIVRRGDPPASCSTVADELRDYLASNHAELASAVRNSAENEESSSEDETDARTTGKGKGKRGLQGANLVERGNLRRTWTFDAAEPRNSHRDVSNALRTLLEHSLARRSEYFRNAR
jgi:hypothetical protein